MGFLMLNVSAALFSEQGGHSVFGVQDSSLPGSAGQGALEIVPGLFSRSKSSEQRGVTRPLECLFPRAVTLWPPCLGELVGAVPRGVISLPWPRTCSRAGRFGRSFPFGMRSFLEL